MEQPELEFAYEGREVGCFDEATCPHSEGQYRYVPYRGIGHYALTLALRTGKCPRCTMCRHPEMSFAVRSSPERGVLQLSDFAVSVVEDTHVSAGRSS
jgi:hypothetical protein